MTDRATSTAMNTTVVGLDSAVTFRVAAFVIGG